MLNNRFREQVALCPACDTSHHYSEITFPMENDWGTWLIACGRCPQHFTIRLRNPRESDGKECRVLARHDDELDPYEGEAPAATAGAVHNLDLNPQHRFFDYAAEPIYQCARNAANLEHPAFAALTEQHRAIAAQLDNAMNMYLAMSRLPRVEHAVVDVPFDCSCGAGHRAFFYMPFKTDGAVTPPPERFLLAHVSGADLADRLTGVFSKTFLMGAIEKLIVRWGLLCDQILVAAPFIGHQYKKDEERLEIWDRLLGFLDPARSVLLTRSKAYGEYKKALMASGIDHGVVARYGLENKIVEAGTRKQDFHAKFYAGLGERSEVLSGSANLVSGKSMENAAFAAMSGARVVERYLDPLKVLMPPPPPRAPFHLMVDQTADGWRCRDRPGAVPDLPA